MSSSLPEGFAVRNSSPADVAAIANLLHAAEVDVRGASNVSASDVAEWFKLVEQKNTWCVEHGNDLAAVGAMFWKVEPPTVWAAVHPRFIGRGLASFLLASAERRARERGSNAIRAGSHAADERAAELFRIRGYREVRRYYTMAIELRERPPEPTLPDGIRIDTFRNEDARAFYDTQTEAFADEWGFAPLPFDEWKRLRLEADDFDPGVWFLAREGEEVVGVIRCDAHHLGGGFVGAVAVRAPWRRRGIGEALLLTAFRAFFDRGERSARLGVDTENPSGATRLYERVGMHVENEEIAYEREL